MIFDAGVPAEQRPAPDIWKLPDVLRVTTHHRHFDPPRRITTAGVDRPVTDAVEIEIQVSEPFVTRAVGPVLWVGDEPLSVAEGGDKNIYRFLAFKPDALKAGAPIALSWGADPAARKNTAHRYEVPQK
jgi:hypothetical protein